MVSSQEQPVKPLALTVAATLLMSHTAHADEIGFNGIAALPGCSGSLFRFADQGLDTKALILTNGHCIGMLGSYEVIVHEPYQTEVTLYDSSEQATSTYLSTEIVYGTMHDTDMAILQLDVTYDEIKLNDNVDPLMMAQDRAVVGEAISIVSGFWEYTTTCELDGFVYAMVEGDWAWTDSLRFTDACETFGGTSGSPVISVETGEIVGVNNTGFEGGEPCSVNNPCEIDEAGAVSTIPEGSYGQQTFHLYSCINEQFELDLDKSDCALPLPSGVLQLGGVNLVTADECDADGNLDAGESATLTVYVENDGPVSLDAARLSISASSPKVSFPGGDDLELNTIDGFGAIAVDIDVLLDTDVADMTMVTFDIQVTDPGSAEPEVATFDVYRVNFDDLPQSATTDDVESNNSAWSASADTEFSGQEGWTRRLDDDANTVWHGADLGNYGDLSLESPVLEIGTGDFTLSFDHRYKFETSQGVHYDGGRIELSTDDGDTWEDASDYADVDYGGTITMESGNPLGNRRGFVDESPDWPNTTQATLDFGTQLAGESVRLRFRVGTDAAVGDFGWEIDNLDAAGLTNTPFSSIQDHDDLCGAGVDITEPTNQVDESTAGCGCSTASSGSGVWLGILGLMGTLLRRRQ